MRPWIASFTSAQKLSFSICLFCIIYLILSTIPQLSVTNVIPDTWNQLGQTSDTYKSDSEFEKQQEINYSSHTSNKSFICDRLRNNDGTRETNVSSPIDDHLVNILRPYCDILPTPRNNWIPAKRYIESDIVFLIYTGASFYLNRATAVRDTWLSRVTHRYFFSGTPYPSLPITVIEDAGEDYSSNLKKIYYGMQIAYKEHNQTAKFYFLVNCDTFVNVPHLLKRLEQFDYNQPLIIGGYANTHKCYIKRDETNYTISYLSGGAGFFLSAQIMELMQPKLNSYFENDWPQEEEKAHSDVALNCLASSMGIKPTFVPGFWAFNPEQTVKESGKEKLHADSEPNTFHNIHPLAMHTFDEFYIHQLLDRLGNDRSFDELMKFTRQFVTNHYELLRIKRRECTLPKV